jgi:hypothetical protein
VQGYAESNTTDVLQTKHRHVRNARRQVLALALRTELF